MVRLIYQLLYKFYAVINANGLHELFLKDLIHYNQLVLIPTLYDYHNQLFLNNKCATQVGKVRAQQLADKEKISIDTIQRMYSYLSRAETYYDESNTEACGTISYLLWGGKAGLNWSRKKLRELGLLNE